MENYKQHLSYLARTIRINDSKIEIVIFIRRIQAIVKCKIESAVFNDVSKKRGKE